MESLEASDLLLHTVLARVTWVVGPVLCRHLFIGPLRRELEKQWPANVIGCETRERSIDRLKSHCRLCGGCKLSRE